MTKRKRFARALRARYGVADGGPDAWWGLRQSAERGGLVFRNWTLEICDPVEREPRTFVRRMVDTASGSAPLAPTWNR